MANNFKVLRGEWVDLKSYHDVAMLQIDKDCDKCDVSFQKPGTYFCYVRKDTHPCGCCHERVLCLVPPEEQRKRIEKAISSLQEDVIILARELGELKATYHV